MHRTPGLLDHFTSTGYISIHGYIPIHDDYHTRQAERMTGTVGNLMGLLEEFWAVGVRRLSTTYKFAARSIHVTTKVQRYK